MYNQRSFVLIVLAIILMAAVASCAPASVAQANSNYSPCLRGKPQPAGRFGHAATDLIVIDAKTSIFAMPASTNVYSGPDKRVIIDDHPLPCNFYMQVPGSAPVNGTIHVAELVLNPDGKVYGIWTRSGWIEDVRLSPIYDFGAYVTRWTGPTQ